MLKRINVFILSALLLSSIIVFHSSCEKEKGAPPLGGWVCGTPDRLPADIVNMDQQYLSGEYIDVDNDGDLDILIIR